VPVFGQLPAGVAHLHDAVGNENSEPLELDMFEFELPPSVRPSSSTSRSRPRSTSSALQGREPT
jgi:hypothetical protein